MDENVRAESRFILMKFISLFYGLSAMQKEFDAKEMELKMELRKYKLFLNKISSAQKCKGTLHEYGFGPKPSASVAYGAQQKENKPDEHDDFYDDDF